MKETIKSLLGPILIIGLFVLFLFGMGASIKHNLYQGPYNTPFIKGQMIHTKVGNHLGQIIGINWEYCNKGDNISCAVYSVRLDKSYSVTDTHISQDDGPIESYGLSVETFGDYELTP